jgi:hypothetical protein
MPGPPELSLLFSSLPPKGSKWSLFDRDDMAKHLLSELDKAGYLVVPKARCERAGMAT